MCGGLIAGASSFCVPPCKEEKGGREGHAQSQGERCGRKHTHTEAENIQGQGRGAHTQIRMEVYKRDEVMHNHACISCMQTHEHREDRWVTLTVGSSISFHTDAVALIGSCA